MPKHLGGAILFSFSIATCVLCGCLVPPIAAAAQEAIPLPVESLLDRRSFGEVSPLAYSPDGRWVAYTVRDMRRIQSEQQDDTHFVRTGLVTRSQAGDIWISNTESGASRNLTEGKGANWDPSWSPDGHFLAFLSDRDGGGQATLWLWDSRKNQLSSPSSVPIRAAYFSNELLWMPDSQRLLITTIPEGLSVDRYAEKVMAPGAEGAATGVAGPSVRVYLGGPISAGGGMAVGSPLANLDAKGLHDLTVVDVMGRTAHALVRGHRIEMYSLSPDGARVAFAIPKRYYKPGSYRRVFDLATVDLATMQEHVLASDILLNDDFSWSPDGAFVSYATYGVDENSYDLYVVGAPGWTPRKLATLRHETSDGLWLRPMWGRTRENFYFILDGTLWSTCVSSGRTVGLSRISERDITHTISESHGQLWTVDGGQSTVVLAHDSEGKQDGFYKVDLVTGKSTKLLEEGKCYTCKWSSYLTSVSGDGLHLAYVVEDAQHAPDLWITDAAFQFPRRLSHLNPQLEKYKMGSGRIIDWLSDDGDRLHGALLLPSDYQPGRRYPLLVWVYPGVALSNHFGEFAFDRNAGPLNMQLFATRGYAVLFPDATERVGERIAGLVKSVLPGVSKVIALGIADPERVGVMGHSQGGFATLALLVATNRFKAAMAADGWGDSTAYYGVLDKDGTGYQYGQAEWQLGGTPWQRPVTYIENSPIYYLDRVETPLLLVHGSNDEAHPAFLADDVFVGLRRLGKKIVYAKYMGEGHTPVDWSYANQLDLARRVITWFETYLKSEGK